MIEGLLRGARRRPEVALFGVGLVLFAGGLVTVLLRANPNEDVDVPRPTVSSAPALGVLGPESGQDQQTYVDGKKSALKERSAKDPRTTTFGIVSFDGYRKVSEVRDFLAARKLQPYSVFVRIPLPGFDVVEVIVADKTLADALSPQIGSKRIESLEDELAALEALIPTTEDPEYKAVYSADAENFRRAIALLKSDPSAVFAVTFETSFANFSKMQGAKGVKLADVPSEGTASPTTHRFRALTPD